MRKTTSRYAKIAFAATVSLGMVASAVPTSMQTALAESDEKKMLHVDEKVDLKSDEAVSVIVELEEVPEKVALAEAAALGEKLTEKEAKDNVEASHSAFEEVLDHVASPTEYEVERTYDAVFNGVTLTLPANKVEKLLDYEGVKAVYSNDTIELVHPIEEKGADEPVEALMAESVPHLGVTDMHVDGLTGKGIKVAVIDTGIDYNHPDLKAAYQGGYDFVDNDDDPMEATYEDWLESGQPEKNLDGRSYYTNHGTHVAGTIAGQAENDSEYAVLGVAPDVDLYAYRVLGPYGSGFTSDVIASIEQSVEDGMDVINLSLGASKNNPTYPTSIASNNAALAGVTVVTSAGNAGLDGLESVGSPATSALAISVGSSSVPTTLPEFVSSYDVGEETLTGDLRVLATSFDTDYTTLAKETFEVVGAGLGYEADFKDIDVDGKIAFISRGEITFVEKIENAKANGAVAVIIYNHVPEGGHIPTYLGESPRYIPSFSLTYEQGSEIAALLAEGSTMTFGEMSELVVAGDVLADTSSRGPVKMTAAIKPEVVAPGVNILSTVPSYMAGPEYIDRYEFAYQRASGTSMASPHVAGVAALMLQADGDLTPAEIKTRLMNTAVPLSEEYNVFEIGAGLINPKAAVATDMTVQTTMNGLHVVDGVLEFVSDHTGAISYGMLSTNKGNIRERHSLRLTNRSSEEKTFTVDVKFHAVNGTLPAAASGVVLQTNKKVTVPAGQMVTNNAFLIAPKTTTTGLYGGYITYTNQADENEVYRVPFGTYITSEVVEPFPIGHVFQDEVAS
ncbi:S8 family serine peptidase [Shouchella lonarensis]|uniref:Peptidase inhibitor I9 n=1 Tax=Shouchella lonarensis TaxID=1464122 RepID=A0A1G6P5Q9_9BACI|nr:S8 family serine peptidase [Shouchella lonarensis]SDC75338.1 Peptidase inhibitor I9 [Shouchella lonarensis]